MLPLSCDLPVLVTSFINPVLWPHGRVKCCWMHTLESRRKKLVIRELPTLLWVLWIQRTNQGNYGD